VYQVRRVWGWLLLAPIVILGIDLLSIAISNLLGRQSVTFPSLSIIGPASLKLMGITFLYQLFFFNLTGEEIGWRGFALPRLLAQTNPILASLVLTFFWVIWHAIYWDATGEPVWTTGYWLDTFVRLFPATVLINWFYIRSKGSILVVGVLHAISNTFFQYIPLDWPVHTATLYGCALLIILIDQSWKKLSPDHPAVYQEQVTDS
jgi:membrane protease YdiL (CAAX protease family)